MADENMEEIAVSPGALELASVLIYMNHAG
jgi:hypothetical protein